MKKILVLGMVLFAMFALNACGPGEVVIPDDAVVAECPAGNIYKYIYKDDLVYEFYFDGELQDESMLGVVQGNVDTAGTARAFLDETFGEGVCAFTTYGSTKE
ncbi:hypothetical protein RJI07_08080 [Mycoplasmatota bacterium WC30]